jgi:NACHT domain
MTDSSSSAWSIAVSRYVATLPPKHKAVFCAPACPEDCLLLVRQAQLRQRKFDKLTCTLEPLIVPLKRFEGSIDVLTQTSSLFVSPVWGPLRCVIGLLCDRLAALSSVTTLLGRLVEPLRRFMNYEKLFENNACLRTAIGALYCDLIEFCSRLVAHHTKSILRKSFGSFDRDVEEIGLKIKHHWAEVDVVANAANLAEAKAARQAEELERGLSRQTEINKWLAPATVEDDVHRLLSSYQDKSCEWILQTPEFSALENASEFHALRITGHPGGGKSTAAAFLVHHLLSSADDAPLQRAVLYFFCKASDIDKTFAITVLRTFIFQLLQTCPSLIQTIQQAYYRSGRSVLDSETETFALFEALISQASSLSIHIVLDAVDECKDAPTLLNGLLELPRNAGLPLKVVLLSRDDPDLKTALQTCDSTLALHSHQEPLEHYIADRVSKLSVTAHIDDSLRKTVIASITETSAGLWLFARLLLDEIEHAPSPEEITRQLQNLPHGLVELYTSILHTKEVKFSPTQVRMAQQIYLWLDKSDYIPARFWKKMNGDSLDDETISCLFKYACSSKQVFHPMKLVQNMCTPLIHTRVLHCAYMIHHQDGYDDDASIYVAEFFHQTAKQYLNWSIDALPSTVPQSLKLRRLGHLHRGIFAIWYFTESADFQQDLRQLQGRPREGDFECMMNVLCGCWRALNVANTSRALVKGHEEEAEELVEQLVWFITTDRCLGFIEATFIVNFSTQFDNTMSATISLLMDTPKQGLTDPPAYSREPLPPALRKLEVAQATLLTDLAYIVASLRLSLIPSVKTPEMPVGFEDRPVAQKILGIARKWQWLSCAPMAVSSNSFLISPKR